MNQRIEFALQALRSGNFRQLCREYGISPKTGYKWRERLLEEGLAGMEERSRRPHRHRAQLGEEVLCEIVRLKGAHPHWGPKKIRALYQRKHRGQAPSESSFKRVLEKAGLVKPRRLRKRSASGRLSQGLRAQAPNEVWSVDFKGWWRDREGLRVEPLTVRDEYSRMILEMRALESSKTEVVQACFQRLFTSHGLPLAIRSDNGPPFASSQGLLGLSRLSAWWLALGIDLESGRPGCPQDNGAHQRMHQDIRRELQAGRVGRDQEAFELWRQQFNTQRPHEALNMQVPAELYQPSPRTYQGTPEDLDYEGIQSRRVHQTGRIKYQAQAILISTSLRGWSVGLSPKPDGLIEVFFSRLLLGEINPTTASFEPALHNS